MKIFYTDLFELPLPEPHGLPVRKYFMLRQLVTASNLVSAEDLVVPSRASFTEIIRAHDPDYVRRVERGTLTCQEIRRIGVPWTEELVERAKRSAGATIQACLAALSDGVAVNLAGGTHHAFRDRGAGYCVFNDGAIASRAMQAEGLVRKVVILDCDAHQGDGTAAIFTDDPSIFTFSIHCQKNYPYHKEKSDLDIGLDYDTQDSVYLDALEKGLKKALELSMAELAIYLAGADPYVDDVFGRLGLSKKGISERDHIVFSHCLRVGIPVAIAMAGGYARRLQDSVDIHFQTVRKALSLEGRTKTTS